MDDIRFDRLTRRLVLSGLTTGSLAALLDLDEVATKKKRSKRKRCRQKKRTFCAGRCCPKRHRCEDKACVVSCEDPAVCPGAEGLGCGAGPNCFCSTTSRGTSACVTSHAGPCSELGACGIADACPPGQICALCDCLTGTPNFRCKRPCPA